MDGGGSVALEYDGVARINTTRLIKNAVALYMKGEINDIRVGDRVTVDGVFQVTSLVAGRANLNDGILNVPLNKLKKV
jgi:hypothetical protein